MIFLPLFGALIMSTTAYLQAEAKWWMGLTSAIAIFILGLIPFYWLPNDFPTTAASTPILGISTTFFLGAILVCFGAICGLLFPKHISSGRIGVLTFIGGFVLCMAVPLFVRGQPLFLHISENNPVGHV